MRECLIACILLLFGGCRLAIVRESDMFYLKRDVSELQEDVARLKREVRDLSRGYSVIPVTITYTNMNATAINAILEGN